MYFIVDDVFMPKDDTVNVSDNFVSYLNATDIAYSFLWFNCLYWNWLSNVFENFSLCIVVTFLCVL